jgi:signal transduction histidine kinase
MQSLRKRAWISGGLSALAAVAIGTYLLYSFLGQKALERFDQTLIARHTQIVAALSIYSNEPDQLSALVFDPAYDTPSSGRYWQMIGPDQEIYTSASLLEATLRVPDAGSSKMDLYDAKGPDAEQYRIAHQLITLEDGRVWSVAVAEDLAEMIADKTETRRSLVLAFALVAAVGLFGTVLQTAVLLRPFDKLRQDVAHRWERDEFLNSAEYPEEVAPLVSDINTLLQRNRDMVKVSRGRAADLAHALKTPSAILRNELTVIAEENVVVDKALAALDRLDAQLARSLARIRLSNSGETTFARTDLSAVIMRFSRLFGKLAERDGKQIRTVCEPNLIIRIDAQDFEEVLGNILDNALKWCRSQISITAHRLSDGIELVVEDDGTGIAAKDRTTALRAGSRLDTSKSGSGLGLAISTDLLKVYDSSLDLGDSALLGGLAVRILIPQRPRA